MNLFQAIILGIVQGLTEFLPVSSSAHVQIASELMQVPGLADENSSTTAFIATIQLGTELAVLIYFARDIMRLMSAWFKGLFNKAARINRDYQLAWMIIVASIPVGVAGLAFRHFIEETVRTLWVIAFTMIIFGIVLYFADKMGKRTKEIKDLNWGNALVYGFGQMLSVIPGVSRSGASISFGLFAGFKRVDAARFAFLIGIPAVLASGLLQFQASYQNLNPDELNGTIVATITSFVVGYLVIAGLLKYLNRGSFLPFVIWRVSVGVILLALLGFGIVAP
ncbi:MAG: undecaprenyl-diphosphate phosphatase [Microbacteriaceae bacterium]|nr:undecaprenyl-diphosphate phosphatase [Microbacteriaceae bacterium]